MKKFSNKKGASFTQVVLFFALIIAGYLLFIKPMILKIETNNVKRSFSGAYVKLDYAVNKLLDSSLNCFEDEKTLINRLKENIISDKVCDDSKKEGCWSSNWLWDEDIPKPGLIFLSNIMVVTDIISPNCDNNENVPNTCAAIYIDINGINKPDKIGVDILKLYVTADGLKPAGCKEDTINPKSSCVLGQNYNWGCTAVYR